MRGQYYITRTILCVLIAAPFLIQAGSSQKWEVFERLSALYYDFRLRITLPERHDSRVVIIDIDERSLRHEGRWPWSRDKLAALNIALFDKYRVNIVGYDIMFPEKDDSSGLSVLERLAVNELSDNQDFLDMVERLRPGLLPDTQFASSMRHGEVVLPMVLHVNLPEEQPKAVGELTTMPLSVPSFIPLPETVGYISNIPLLQSHAAHGGFINNPSIDGDGIYRRIPMLLRYGENAYESLSLAIIRTLWGMPDVELEISTGYADGDPESGVLEGIKIDNFYVPVDGRGIALIPFIGQQGSFQYVSATDVISGNADPGILENAIALVGTSAAGLKDIRPTPVQNVFPGVEVHANMITGIIDGTFKHRPQYAQAVEFTETAFIVAVMTILLPMVGPLAGSFLFAILLGCVLGLDIYLWQMEMLSLDPMLPILALLSLFTLQMSYSFLTEARSKARISRIFGQYIPPELVEEMSSHPGDYGISGESREMTVLFSDVRGFTTISEGLNPEELTRLMNALLTPMTAIIHKHRGTIDKYMGDAIMAFWGAPIEDKEHARHALESALEMIEKLDSLQEEFAKHGWPPMKMGVGLNTGLMNVGNMGSEFRMAYTVLGDTVNLGSRLEGITKQYGVSIIVSETTAAAVPDHLFRELDRVRVKGKEEPVTIFEPLGPATGVSSEEVEELEKYHAALLMYRRQAWLDAEEAFRELQRYSPGRKIYPLYLERIMSFKDNPPPLNWDGVFVHTSK